MMDLLTEGISEKLRSAAKACKRPAWVAVAYFGKGASSLLPLSKGSRLVVNADEATVKAGQTCPADLKVLREKGVRVYSVKNLHAKIYVLGRKAYIGSANISRHSANRLIEVMVATTDQGTVSAARDFIDEHCLQELGPKELERLQELYKPPKFPGNTGKRTRKDKKTKPLLSRAWIDQFEFGDPPEGSEATEEAGEKAARKRMEKPRSHVLDKFWLPGNVPYKAGDMLLQVVDEGKGRKMASPPANVLSTRKWNGIKPCTFVYMELPRRRQVTVEQLAKKIGRGAKKQLSRQRVVLKKEFVERLLAAWKD